LVGEGFIYLKDSPVFLFFREAENCSLSDGGRVICYLNLAAAYLKKEVTAPIGFLKVSILLMNNIILNGTFT
jgi:hypothetical protein